MNKKTLYIFFLIFFTTSCSTFDSVKRGLTGEKQNNSDEFLIQKKDPLILPPDYANLPSPEDIDNAPKELSSFEKALGKSVEETTSKSGSTEDSILKRIRSK
jgi:hypothetical protein|tara:strand:- start:590 stop:895 length:306 start_codon:yes stop_codon:yes gene_type:complete